MEKVKKYLKLAKKIKKKHLIWFSVIKLLISAIGLAVIGLIP
ncbi:MAG: hypothetical protein WCK11_01635 [Candidatus Falkowbacteria bacterium]